MANLILFFFLTAISQSFVHEIMDVCLTLQLPMATRNRGLVLADYNLTIKSLRQGTVYGIKQKTKNGPPIFDADTEQLAVVGATASCNTSTVANMTSQARAMPTPLLVDFLSPSSLSASSTTARGVAHK